MAKAKLFTVEDVLHHLPRRYEDRRHLPPISELKPGTFATVKGRLMNVDSRPSRGGMVILKATITDGKGTVTLVWFNQPWIRKKLEGYKGEVIAYGQVKEASWSYEIHNAEFEIIEEDDDPEDFAKIVPVYPLVDGLPQKVMRKAAESAVEYYLDFVKDPLPEWLLRREKLKPLKWALSQIHLPMNEDARTEARRRLVFDEFFYMQVALALKRAESHADIGISFPLASLGEGGKDGRSALAKELQGALPFELTGAQKRVIKEIWADMMLPHPMNRLVQGDVGSGKTVVAAAAMLAAVRCGYQAALMAPTEILAEQHYVNLHRLLEPLGIEVALLVGKQTAAQKKKAYEQTASGKAQIAVGTHALIQEGVEFQKLGLAVVDEQHRFGVMQRVALRNKSMGNPDVLVMTATPIPRTLTMAVFGDLDLSIIDELPPGRKPIITHWMSTQDRAAVYDNIRGFIEQGRQAYVVCPMVSESEKMLAQAAEELHGRLSKLVFPDLRIGLLHGQMKPKEKEEVMDAFRRHDLDVLVSTTVIEVGVDVPNASVMVIEDANRFGLSQLHQLRGRVGRGQFQSYCILVCDTKTEDARERMEVMVLTNDGFKIAEEDLRLRGPGELAGTKQSGNLDFKVADLVQDSRLLEVARQAAMDLVNHDPQLSHPEHRPILAHVRKTRGDEAVIAVS